MKKALPFIILIILLFVIKTLIGSLFSLQEGLSLYTNLTHEYADKKKQNEFFEEKLKFVKTNTFIEDQARMKLNLTKPGESLVALPQPTPQQSQTILSATHTAPNWKLWWDLFF